ncbi:MAG TPA: hypothetical protein VM578_04135 [Candidatus Saccharimonadales bacterium]|nr:hypothetical protein [Candidatus Saccharimonadales bacterium]
MASTAVDKGAAKPEAEEVKRLQTELETLKKEFEARLSAVESLLPKAGIPAPAEPQVSPETLAMIAVAVTAYLGKKVKIRSARLIPTVNSWAQAGRATVQASHNLKR